MELEYDNERPGPVVRVFNVYAMSTLLGNLNPTQGAALVSI